jgi:mannose-6-phosphate isomerase
MTVEWARATPIAKPWGRSDLSPWFESPRDGRPIGEIHFLRDSADAARPALLLKLLFAAEALSIQVHPDDDAARAIGLPNGKSEAWYVLEAAEDATIGLGLRDPVEAPALRRAVEDASIADLLAWRRVSAGEAIAVPAGTIHALGAGLVVAEVQQNSDTTFRLFDHGRGRALQVTEAISVAHPGPVARQTPPVRLSPGRIRLVATGHFILEKFDLPAGSAWLLQPERETWLLVIGGTLRVTEREAGIGEAVFLDNDAIGIEAGAGGLTALLAYPGETQPHLLTRLADAAPPGWPHVAWQDPAPFAVAEARA